MALTDRGVGECVLPQLLQGRKHSVLGHLVILKHVNESNTITNLPAQELDRIVEELWVRDLQRLVLLVEGDTACGAKFNRDLSLRAKGESTPSQQDGHAFSKSTALFQSQVTKYGTVSFRGSGTVAGSAMAGCDPAPASWQQVCQAQ